MKHPEDEGYRQPLAFIGIGSSSEQEMQQILIEDKVGQSPSKIHFTTNKLQLAKSGTHTKFIKMAGARKRSGVSYRQHGVEAF